MRGGLGIFDALGGESRNLPLERSDIRQVTRSVGFPQAAEKQLAELLERRRAGLERRAVGSERRELLCEVQRQDVQDAGRERLARRLLFMFDPPGEEVDVQRRRVRPDVWADVVL